MSDAARTEILRRIGEAGTFSTVTPDPLPAEAPREVAQIVDQFAEYAADYKATVLRVEFPQLKEAIAEQLRTRAKTSVVVPADFPADWMDADLPITRDEGLATSDLATFDAVMTGCALAIAETGTLVLDAGFAQGRRALTLIPDYHLCLVFERQVVDSVPEAVAKLEAAVREGRPLTWISGPSATSDIELSRVEGVHGPRVLDILLVAD